MLDTTQNNDKGDDLLIKQDKESLESHFRVNEARVRDVEKKTKSGTRRKTRSTED